MNLIPLHLMFPGQTAEIGQLLGAPEQIHRLEELGLRRGVRVQMVDAGQPCIIRVGDLKLCFRQADAFQVYVDGSSGP